VVIFTKNRIIIFKLIKALLYIVAILYISFLIIDFFNIDFYISSEKIKYLCILICFFISILTSKDVNEAKDIHLLQMGLLLTLLADLCLLILNYFTLGVAIFCLVQITYSVRYTYRKKCITPKYFIIFFSIIMTLYSIIYLFIMKIDILFPIAFFYAICLITSVTNAIKAYKDNSYPAPNKYMIALAMILFLLCDINVGLYNITSFTANTSIYLKEIAHISGFLMWFYYLPSQVLLCLSGYDFNK
jgi:hypothetical protein